MVGHYWLRTPDLAPTSRNRRRNSRQSGGRAQVCRTDPQAEDYRQRRPAFTPRAAHRHRRLRAEPEFVDSGAWHAPTSRYANPLYRQHRPAGHRRDPDGGWGRNSVARWSSSCRNPAALRRPATACWKLNMPIKPPGLDFASTPSASRSTAADRPAHETEAWLARFPMWDWVGGRTSVMSAVGSGARRTAAIEPSSLPGRRRGDGRLTRRTE